MKRILALWGFFWVLTLAVCDTQPLCAQEDPVLEQYVIGHGGTQGGDPTGLVAQLSDKFLGNGSATVLIRFKTKDDASELSLKVRRKVKRKDVTFALLVFRVEVRGYDLADTLVFSQDLDGFTFGDSQSGRWSERLDQLPADIQRIEITFIGNYE